MLARPQPERSVFPQTAHPLGIKKLRHGESELYTFRSQA
jgi:hypothetical protein